METSKVIKLDNNVWVDVETLEAMKKFDLDFLAKVLWENFDTKTNINMKRITNLIILDASSSMEPKRQEVIEGTTKLLQEIKADAIRDAEFVKTTTIVLEFSSPNQQKVLLNTEDSSTIDIEMMSKYRPDGWTALFDAIGQGFRLIPLGQDNVFVSIFTDGEENKSMEFTHALVKDLITVARDRQWAVTFMGTTEEALQKATSFGISKNNMFQFNDSKKGVTDSFEKMRGSRGVYYQASMSGNASATFDSLMKNDD